MASQKKRDHRRRNRTIRNHLTTPPARTTRVEVFENWGEAGEISLFQLHDEEAAAFIDFLKAVSVSEVDRYDDAEEG